MISTAHIAGRHQEWRYTLGRWWGHEETGEPIPFPVPEGVMKEGKLVFVMLNPSTADSKVDDPTIRRCIAFAKRERYVGIEVVNLFAWRDSDPGFLKEAEQLARGNWRKHVKERRALKLNALDLGWFIANEEQQYVGEDNDKTIIETCRHRDVVLAWGAHAPMWRVMEVREIVGASASRAFCLGKTSKGAYRHPLFVRGDQRLEKLF